MVEWVERSGGGNLFPFVVASTRGLPVMDVFRLMSRLGQLVGPGGRGITKPGDLWSYAFVHGEDLFKFRDEEDMTYFVLVTDGLVQPPQV